MHFYQTIKQIFIWCVFSLVFCTHGFAGNTKDDSSWVKIDQIKSDGEIFTVNKKITFEGYFRDPGTMDVYSIIWDFGDGNFTIGTLTTSSDVYANPGRCSPYKNICVSTVRTENTYSKPGKYNVTFSVKNRSGMICEDSTVISIEENHIKD